MMGFAPRAAVKPLIGWTAAVRVNHRAEPGGGWRGDTFAYFRRESTAAARRRLTIAPTAATILAGIAAGRREIPVGDGPEMGLVGLRGSDPDRLFDLMAGSAPQVAR